MTDKKLALEIIKLMSAVESWSFATKNALPDYMYDQISTIVETLTKEILEWPTT